MTDNTLLIVGTVLVVLFASMYRILIQLKKRYRSIDIRLSNNNEWVLMNYKSVTESLDKINKAILNAAPGGRIVDMNKPPEIPGKIITTPIEREHKKQHLFRGRDQRISSLFNQQEIPDTIQGNSSIQQYYSSILEELQHLNQAINQQQEYEYENMYNSK